MLRSAMPRKPRITVTQETESGRNTNFRDNSTGKNMTRLQFVRKIEKGDYADYHIRRINDVETPASNPNKSEKDNLG